MRAVCLTVYHKSRSGPLEQPRLRGVSVNGAFIRDKFVDYPTAQSTKREIKARSGRRRIPAEIRARAMYLWKSNALHATSRDSVSRPELRRHVRPR